MSRANLRVAQTRLRELVLASKRTNSVSRRCRKVALKQLIQEIKYAYRSGDFSKENNLACRLIAWGWEFSSSPIQSARGTIS